MKELRFSQLLCTSHPAALLGSVPLLKEGWVVETPAPASPASSLTIPLASSRSFSPTSQGATLTASFHFADQHAPGTEIDHVLPSCSASCFPK